MSPTRQPRLFLDAVDTAPMDRAVADAYASSIADGWADPRRNYAEAARARLLLGAAREEIAALLGSRPAYTHFAPSPAVAAERIVLGVSAARRGRSRAVVSAAEPQAVRNAAAFASPDGVDVAAVDATGRLLMHSVARQVAAPGVTFAAVAQANLEVGTVQSLDEAYAAALSVKVPLIVDASVAGGHIHPPRSWDALVVSPASWGGPAGMGVLALKPELRWAAAWSDGAPWAPGSTSIPAAVAAATALRLRTQARAASASHLAELAKTLRSGLRSIPDVIVHDGAPDTLPHVVGATFVYADAPMLQSALDAEGIAVGAGCSCGEDSQLPCPTLRAMGTMTHGFVRFGLHTGIDAAGIDRAVAALRAAVTRVRVTAGVPA